MYQPSASVALVDHYIRVHYIPGLNTVQLSIAIRVTGIRLEITITKIIITRTVSPITKKYLHK